MPRRCGLRHVATILAALATVALLAGFLHFGAHPAQDGHSLNQQPSASASDNAQLQESPTSHDCKPAEQQIAALQKQLQDAKEAVAAKTGTETVAENPPQCDCSKACQPQQRESDAASRDGSPAVAGALSLGVADGDAQTALFFKSNSLFETLIGEAWDSSNIYSTTRTFKVSMTKAFALNRNHHTLMIDTVKKNVIAHLNDDDVGEDDVQFDFGQMWYTPYYGNHYKIFSSTASGESYVTHINRFYGQETHAYLTEKLPNAYDKGLYVIISCTIDRLDRLKLLLGNQRKTFEAKDVGVILVAVLEDDAPNDAMAVFSFEKAVKDSHIEDRTTVVPFKGEFSRGAALHLGITKAMELAEDPAILLTDVDVFYLDQFLHRCYAYATPGRSAYFPIVFSLFRDRNSLRLQDNFGDWRVYGTGIACFAASDYERAGGLASMKGWGGEDIDLFLKFTKLDQFSVLRSVDQNILHVWHEKDCDVSLPPDKLHNCLKSMVQYDGDKLDIALRFLKVGQSMKADPTSRALAEVLEKGREIHTRGY